MAFMFYAADDGRVPASEYLPCGSITPKQGMALKQAVGVLVAAALTDAPTYVSLCERASACTSGELIPVLRVQPDMIFETTFASSSTGVNPGDHVNIHTDGLRVTALTTGSPHAELVYKESDASGAMCRVRFN